MIQQWNDAKGRTICTQAK